MWAVMTVCHELKLSETEVRNWQVDDLTRWMTYFVVRNEEQSKAYETAKRRGSR